MRKRRFEILLPRTYNDGRAIEKEKLDQTDEELLSRFHGLRRYPGEFLGLWLSGGRRYEDVAVRLIVDDDDTEESGRFFREYKEALKKRFEQKDVYIAAFEIDVI